MYFWHLQRPSSWDRYYSQSSSSMSGGGIADQRHASITSGIAAALTIGIFFAVFLLTFGCRLLNGRRRRTANGGDGAAAPRYALDDQRMFVVCSPPPPLPSYEDALKMFPARRKDGADDGQPSPPSFHAPFQVPSGKLSGAEAAGPAARSGSSGPADDPHHDQRRSSISPPPTPPPTFPADPSPSRPSSPPPPFPDNPQNEQTNSK